jgi:hypothetical protein
MPNFSTQAPTYYAGLKSYDDRSFINFWTIQSRDQLLNKLYFSNISGFATTTASTPIVTTVGLNKSSIQPKSVVSWKGFDKDYSSNQLNPYLIDNTIPAALIGGTSATQLVNWTFSSADWFRYAGKSSNTAFAAITELYFYTDASTATGSGYKVVITPTPASTVALAAEYVAEFQLSANTYTSPGYTAVVTNIGTPTGTAIKAVKVTNPDTTASNIIAPFMVYQANNRYQFPGASISYRVCCINNFEWTREFDRAERTCSGKVTSKEITKETNTITLEIKEEDAIIWGLMTGQIPSIKTSDILKELNGYEKGNNNLVPSTGILNLPTKPKVVNISTKDCANLQLVSSSQVNLGTNDYTYNPLTGDVTFNVDQAKQSVSIIVADVADVTEVNLVPLTDGYRGYLEVQRRGKNDRLKITKFANVDLTMPSISADDAGDTLSLELNVSNTTKGDIVMLFA